ncbi:hypothetical protein ACLKA7_005034 [Drosophila subpalustris]
MYQQGGRYKWAPQQQWSGRGRGRGRGLGGWRQFGPPPAYGPCACPCHEDCCKCCVGWVAAPQTANTTPAAVPPAAAPPAAVPPAAAPPAAVPPAAAPPAAAPPAGAPPGWVRIDELRGSMLTAQPRPVVGWVQLDADGNVPPAQPR